MKKWVVLNKQKAENPAEQDLAPRDKQPFVRLRPTQGRHITEKEIISILLKNRGLTRRREIEEFLNPSLDGLNFKNLAINKRGADRAVKRIRKAIENKESVVVYTDYDVDGLTGGAIVWETLYEFGAKIMPYIPHRVHEGYGLSKQGIDNVRKQFHPSLIITVDHGINAGKLIDYARKQGIDTIIIDHHLLPAKLPEAYAIVHTTKIAAGALAWYFCNYLRSYFKHIPVKKLLTNNLDLAALATIADMIPVTKLNRAIVKYGLKQLNKTKRIGLKALIHEASIDGKEIGVYEAGRIIAPRINAMGRLTHALDALRLICTRDEERAVKLAKILGSVNRERQILLEETTNHAIRSVNIKTDCRLVFAAHESYQQGVIGLVAGKLAEKYCRPAIVVSKGLEYCKASARSVSGINIFDVIRRTSDLLIDVGGHPMAAGFTIATKNLDKFRIRIEKLLSSKLTYDFETKEIKIDMELILGQITSDLYQIIQKFAPFGIGNPEPLFISRNVKIIRASLVGKNKQHLKLVLLKNYQNDTIPAIGFNLGEIYSKLGPETALDIVFTIEEDVYNDKVPLQLKLKDVKMADLNR